MEVLAELFEKILDPPAVQVEFGKDFDFEGLTIITVENPGLAIALKTQIDEGEANAIAPAMLSGDIFIFLDGVTAPRGACQMVLKVIGTIGVLLLANRQEVIPAVRPVL